MDIQFAEQMPERIIALAPVCLEVGPNSSPLRAIPTITIFGEKDGRQMPILWEKLPKERAEHAQWAIAVQWGRRHEFARANNIVLPWFDHAIRLRYPADATLAAGPVRLRTLDESTGWLGSVDWSGAPATIRPYGEFPDEKSAACWFPNSYLAHAWRSFVSKPSDLSLKMPAGLGDGQPLVELPADQPLEIEASIRGAPETFASLAVHDGDRELAKLTPGTSTAKLPPLSPGIHVLFLQGSRKDGSQVLSAPNTVLILGAERRD
jgi:hypothetical protein